jgi:hypothetical protein
VRSHDEPLWRWTDKIKRIAHQRKCGLRGGSEDTPRHRWRQPSSNRLHGGTAARGLKLYLVILANVFESTEKSVAMAGDSDVSGFPGKRSAGDVPDSQPQDSRAVPCKTATDIPNFGISMRPRTSPFLTGGVGGGLRVLFFGLDFVFQTPFC